MDAATFVPAHQYPVSMRIVPTVRIGYEINDSQTVLEGTPLIGTSQSATMPSALVTAGGTFDLNYITADAEVY